MNLWAALALAAGAGPGDLGVRLERFPSAMTVPAVEALLADPAGGWDAALSWGERLRAEGGLAGPLRLAAELLGAPAGGGPAAAPEACADLPEALRGPASRLDVASRRAAEAARRAAASYSDAERAALLAVVEGTLRRKPLSRVDAATADLAARHHPGPLVRAAAELAQAAESELPALRAAASAEPRGSWRCGAVSVYGVQDDVHRAPSAAASVLIDLGGDNVHKGGGAAGPGEARLVVDLGQRLVFESTGSAFGAGVFGVGLLYAPEPGPKFASAGDVSLGAGLFGAGGALLEGPDAAAKSGRFGQGAAAFGAAVFSTAGSSATLSADFAGQGFASTRGAGLLLVRSAGARLECGLRHADPREPLALISMCQGAAEGPRGHAGGGVGLAVVEGDGARLRSSYFAQGAGYWHAFGGLYVRGDGVRLEARRYGQGAGVHAGAGLLSWRGSDGRSAIWGVGPAMGWDYGLGLLELRGHRNALQSEWAAGRGDVNGRALADVQGDDNALRLNDWGTASYRRLAAGYALTRVAGEGNRLWTPGLAADRTGAFDIAATPWGVTRGVGRLVLTNDVSSAAVSWPVPDRAADAAAGAAALSQALESAESLPPAAKARRWLSLASSLAIDGGESRSAAARLMSLPPSAAAYVVPALSVEEFDESLWIRLFAASAGETAARLAHAELNRASGLRRAWLADLLRFGPAGNALGAAKTLLKDADWRQRRAGAVLLGAAFGDERGEEPGRVRLLEESLALARSTFTAGGSEEAAAFARIGVKRLADLYGVLALDPALSAETRLRLLAAGDPFDTAKTETLRRFTEALRAGAKRYGPAIQRELAQAGASLVRARTLLRAAAEDRDPDVRAAAYAALGQAGAPKDAERLGRALDEDGVVPREAAALGLARLGADGRAEIEARLGSASARTRAAALLAAALSSDPEVGALARRGFSDPEPSVRRAAVAALGAIPSDRAETARAQAAAELRRLAAEDPDPSTAASAAVWLGRLAR